MLELTVRRVMRKIPAERVIIITNSSQVRLMREQVPFLPARNIVAEPMGRDTAPCIAFAAAIVSSIDKDALMLVLPADHMIGKDAEFWNIVRAGMPLCSGPEGKLVTFGIVPTSPRTGYGYIRRGGSHAKTGGVEFSKVARFTEKPDLKTAQKYFQSGNYFWNSGIFLWSAASIRESFRAYAPEIDKVAQGFDRVIRKGRVNRAALAGMYGSFPKISIDYAIMEKSDRVLVAQSGFSWNDVGSWPSVREYLDSDGDANAWSGLFSGLDCKGCTVISDQGQKHLVAALGLENIVIVHTADATLVCPESRAEEIKKIVSKAKADPKLKRFT